MTTRRTDAWNTNEDELLISYFDANGNAKHGYADSVARKIGRTTAAVNTRVTALRKKGRIARRTRTTATDTTSLAQVVTRLESVLQVVKRMHEKEQEKKHGIMKKIADLLS